MKTLLLTTTFNSQTQAIYTKLKDLNYTVSVCFAINEQQILQEIEAFKPKLILCPFLKSYLPASVYKNYPTYILHPAPRGDRGAYSLEYALQEPIVSMMEGTSMPRLLLRYAKLIRLHSILKRWFLLRLNF